MIAIGRRIYSLGVLLLGLVEIRFGGFSPDWLAVPAGLPGYRLIADSAFAFLVVAGLAMNFTGTSSLAAVALTLFFGAATMVVQVPVALKSSGTWGGWQGVAESAVMALGGGFALLLSTPMLSFPPKRLDQIVAAARAALGLCLLVFGVSHFVYAKYTASLAPAWLPPSQLFWAYITGWAQIAAGVSMICGVLAPLAAILLTTMYLGFGALVHLPSLIAAPGSHDNWAENAINLILTGSVWCVADWLAAEKRRRKGLKDSPAIGT